MITLIRWLHVSLISIYFPQVVSQHSHILAPMAVQAVKKIMSNMDDQNVNLRMIKIVKKLGETVDESQLIDGALIEQSSMGHGGPSRVEKAKIGLIQFQISPPKTNVCFDNLKNLF